MNHSWQESIKKGYIRIQTCSRCRILREKRTVKQLMAIVNHPPWTAYKYEYVWHYTTGVGPTTTKRPNCSIKPTWRKGLK
jgi:hypothetical protein